MSLIDDILGGDPLDELGEIIEKHYSHAYDLPDSDPIVKVLDSHLMASIWEGMDHIEISDAIDGIIDHMSKGEKIFKQYCEANNNMYYFSGTPGDLLKKIYKAKNDKGTTP
jgi:hypothetical protein